MATTYKGFSTQAGNRNFRLTDFNLIKQDILNHFNIRKGEKLMRPNFGTLIPYTLFNSETEATTQIQSEVEKAFAQQLDLLTLQQTNVTSDIYTSTLTVEVIYGLPNDEVTSTLIGLVFSQGANPIYEELL